MNSIHRAGAAIATVAAIVTVAAALFVQGYATAEQTAAQSVAHTAVAGASSTPTATLGPRIVYVNPAPSPQSVNVTQTQPPAAPPVIHVVVPNAGGDDAGGTDD